jgi:hypothetical protein
MNDEMKKCLFEGVKKEIINNITLYDGDMVVSVLEQTYGVDDDNWDECGNFAEILLLQLADEIKELLEQLKLEI